MIERMTGAELRACLHACDLSNVRAAALLGVSPRAVQLWLIDERPIPALVRRVMRSASRGLLSVEALERL